jgi:hypothetical protein
MADVDLLVGTNVDGVVDDASIIKWQWANSFVVKPYI